MLLYNRFVEQKLDLAPKRGGKGLGTDKCFLGCAVLFSGNLNQSDYSFSMVIVLATQQECSNQSDPRLVLAPKAGQTKQTVPNTQILPPLLGLG